MDERNVGGTCGEEGEEGGQEDGACGSPTIPKGPFVAFSKWKAFDRTSSGDGGNTLHRLGMCAVNFYMSVSMSLDQPHVVK